MRQIGKKDSSYAECPTFEADPMLQVSLGSRLQGELNEANPMPQISKKDSSYAERSTLEADPMLQVKEAESSCAKRGNFEADRPYA